MTLLDDALRDRLPSIHQQEPEVDPVVLARYWLPGTTLQWFVTEGELDGQGFMFFGYVLDEGDFRYFSLAELETARSPLGQPVQRDLTFTERRLTDVVPIP